MTHFARALVVQTLCMPFLLSCGSPPHRSAYPAPETSQATTPTAPSPNTKSSDEELAETRKELAKLHAAIVRDIEIYRKTYGRSHILTETERESRFANYARDWVAKIERVGNANYPDEARGRMYGSVYLSVTIKADGSVQEAKIERSSGHEVLDQATLRIIRLASPFQAFPTEIAKDKDTLVIPRVWSFMPGNELVSFGP